MALPFVCCGYRPPLTFPARRLSPFAFHVPVLHPCMIMKLSLCMQARLPCPMGTTLCMISVGLLPTVWIPGLGRQAWSKAIQDFVTQACKQVGGQLVAGGMLACRIRFTVCRLAKCYTLLQICYAILKVCSNFITMHFNVTIIIFNKRWEFDNDNKLLHTFFSWKSISACMVYDWSTIDS